MRSLITRLAKLERKQPEPGKVTGDDVHRYLREHQDKEIEAMDADDPRLPLLVPGWQPELIRARKRGEAIGGAEGVIPDE
ncbi:MAG TPA: hypothetical protein VKE40_07015 [Gemmataceae bacterium]|nr:hypothetical protein [Gemmataceae bacterium]